MMDSTTAPALAIGPTGSARRHPIVEAGEDITLCEALDRLLHKGAVVKGELTISVADVDLVYVGLHVLLASVETIRGDLCPNGNQTSTREGR